MCGVLLCAIVVREMFLGVTPCVRDVPDVRWVGVTVHERCHRLYTVLSRIEVHSPLIQMTSHSGRLT